MCGIRRELRRRLIEIRNAEIFEEHGDGSLAAQSVVPSETQRLVYKKFIL
jgi:hypothetical protein